VDKSLVFLKADMWKIINKLQRIRTGRISVAYTPDSRYALPLTVSLVSLLENYSFNSPIDIYLLGGEFPEEERRLLTQSVDRFLRKGARLIWLACDPGSIRSLRTELHFSYVVYLRLLLPELLDRGMERILYLDCDTLIQSDVTPLFHHDMGENALLAAQDRNVCSFDSPIADLKDKVGKFNIPAEEKYFNAGVLLFNLTVWRQEKLSERILNFCQENQDALFLADQNAVNIFLHKRIGELDFSWNHQFLLKQFREGLTEIPIMKGNGASPKILHFVSNEKPWLPDCAIPERNQFISYWKKTRWPLPAWVSF
jgi:lipopolysaccharide biosynthesis glycosyltransferase